MSSTTERTSTSVVVVDSHEVVRTGWHAMLDGLGGIEVLGEASDGMSAVRLVSEQSPDVIIMDVVLPLLDGLEATRQILAANPEARVIICSGECGQTMVEEALRAGAKGYLLKSSVSMELALAIRTVMRGETYLSPKAAETVVDRYIRQPKLSALPSGSLSTRERQVLRHLADGKSNKQISVELSISVRTVEAHRTQLMEKLNLRSVAELTKYAIREGITTVES